jgi:hypothetical protein
MVWLDWVRRAEEGKCISTLEALSVRLLYANDLPVSTQYDEAYAWGKLAIDLDSAHYLHSRLPDRSQMMQIVYGAPMCPISAFD